MKPKTVDAAGSKTPNPVDLHVGGKVRMRRKFLGLSQEGLAATIDLTFQQVQKYERGFNRISASKLYEISRTLKAPIQYFFEGYAGSQPVECFSESESEQFVHGFLMTTEGIELAEAFPRIKNAKHRRRIMELVRVLADDEVDADVPHASRAGMGSPAHFDGALLAET